MNEQIKQLLPAPSRAQGQQIAYDGYDKAFCNFYSIEQMVEFAELIIKECISAVREDYVDRGTTEAVLSIEKHFGVE